MSRWAGIPFLLQAGVFAGLAWWAGERWDTFALIGWVLCAVQAVGGVGLLSTGKRAVGFGAAVLTLLGDAVMLGLALAAAQHVATRFGASATSQGETAMAVILVAIPWLAGLPCWQLVATFPRKAVPKVASGVTAVLLAGLCLPLARQALADQPAQTWPEQPELAAAAEASWARWNGSEAALPTGAGPATVILTTWTEGKASEGVLGEGSTLSGALEQALGRLPPRISSKRQALVVDLARTEWTDGLTRIGSSGAIGKEQGRSASVLWRPGNVRYGPILPEWSVPSTKLPKNMRRAEVDSVLVDDEGARRLFRAWAEGPKLDADEALQAAVDGGDMILRNMRGNRYSYIIKGPSGGRGSGYNFPRHAGVTWYLARLYLRTGEARFREGAERGLAHMADSTATLPDGRAYVADPKRKDGKVWVGTTSLAVLGAAELDHELALPWGRFLASSIDEQGAVRGELDAASGEFPPQQMNPYGQGQTVLALAILVRAGHEELRPALERSARFLDAGYAPGGAGRLVVLDEHWTCIASQAIADVMDEPHGSEVCQAYLDQQAHRTPREESSSRPHTSSAGGLAEAVVSGSVVLGSERWSETALAYGQHFLDSAYRPEDAPFLANPETLMGGFRNTHTDLDVQMDAVQHVGCALLGVEALLRGEVFPGNYP